MKLSFGMIFSIILIIVFISFAIFGVTRFLNLQKTVQAGKFSDDLQVDVDRLWQGSFGSQVHEYLVPNSVGRVCFGTDPGDNMELRTREGRFSGSYIIEHIDISENFCVDNIDGKIKLRLEKEAGEALVTITGE